MRMHQTDRPMWSCDKCQQTFNYKSNFTKHLKKHKEDNEKMSHRKPKSFEKGTLTIDTMTFDSESDADDEEERVPASNTDNLTNTEEFEVVRNKYKNSDKSIIYLVKYIGVNPNVRINSEGGKYIPDMYPRSGRTDWIPVNKICNYIVPGVSVNPSTAHETILVKQPVHHADLSDIVSKGPEVPMKVPDSVLNNSKPIIINAGGSDKSLLPNKGTVHAKHLTIKNSGFTSLLENKYTTQNSMISNSKQIIKTEFNPALKVAQAVKQLPFVGSTLNVNLAQTGDQSCVQSDKAAEYAVGSTSILSNSAKNGNPINNVDMFCEENLDELSNELQPSIGSQEKYVMQKSVKPSSYAKSAMSFSHNTDRKTVPVSSQASHQGTDRKTAPVSSQASHQGSSTSPVDSILMETIFKDIFQSKSPKPDSDGDVLSEEEVKRLLLHEHSVPFNDQVL